MENNQQQPEVNLLENVEYELVQASGGKRFANYLIDLAFFYALIITTGIVIAIVSPETLAAVNTESTGFSFVDRLITWFLYGVYMFVIEAVFKGKSLGKLITGTRAVNEDGTKISFQTALMRGFSRIVPLEQFSALGSPSYPWHDKWTDTYVIDEKQSNYHLRISE